MKYLLMIYEEEKAWNALSDAERGKIYGEYMQFSNEIKAEGKYVGGNPLKPTSTATTVRVRNGKQLVTDGPFAETKEQLGGYFLIEATDLDDAIKIAARIPGAKMGSIEVRPVLPVYSEGRERGRDLGLPTLLVHGFAAELSFWLTKRRGRVPVDGRRRDPREAWRSWSARQFL